MSVSNSRVLLLHLSNNENAQGTKIAMITESHMLSTYEFAFKHPKCLLSESTFFRQKRGNRIYVCGFYLPMRASLRILNATESILLDPLEIKLKPRSLRTLVITSKYDMICSQIRTQANYIERLSLTGYFLHCINASKATIIHWDTYITTFDSSTWLSVGGIFLFILFLQKNLKRQLI